MTKRLYRDGTLIIDVTTASTGTSGSNFTPFPYGSTYGADRLWCVGSGGAMNAAQEALLRAALQTFKTALGPDMADYILVTEAEAEAIRTACAGKMYQIDPRPIDDGPDFGMYIVPAAVTTRPAFAKLRPMVQTKSAKALDLAAAFPFDKMAEMQGPERAEEARAIRKLELLGEIAEAEPVDAEVKPGKK